MQKTKIQKGARVLIKQPRPEGSWKITEGTIVDAQGTNLRVETKFLFFKIRRWISMNDPVIKLDFPTVQ